jgi:hypothetical protein
MNEGRKGGREVDEGSNGGLGLQGVAQLMRRFYGDTEQSATIMGCWCCGCEQVLSQDLGPSAEDKYTIVPTRKSSSELVMAQKWGTSIVERSSNRRL